MEREKLRKRSGVIDASINSRIQEIEDRISGAEDTRENIDNTIKIFCI
jgi:flagellar biosynthesis/type III secretory pathway protein FliH